MELQFKGLGFRDSQNEGEPLGFPIITSTVYWGLHWDPFRETTL